MKLVVHVPPGAHQPVIQRSFLVDDDDLPSLGDETVRHELKLVVEDGGQGHLGAVPVAHPVDDPRQNDRGVGVDFMDPVKDRLDPVDDRVGVGGLADVVGPDVQQDHFGVGGKPAPVRTLKPDKNIGCFRPIVTFLVRIESPHRAAGGKASDKIHVEALGRQVHVKVLPVGRPVANLIGNGPRRTALGDGVPQRHDADGHRRAIDAVVPGKIIMGADLIGRQGRIVDGHLVQDSREMESLIDVEPAQVQRRTGVTETTGEAHTGIRVLLPAVHVQDVGSRPLTDRRDVMPLAVCHDTAAFEDDTVAAAEQEEGGDALRIVGAQDPGPPDEGGSDPSHQDLVAGDLGVQARSAGRRLHPEFHGEAVILVPVEGSARDVDAGGCRSAECPRSIDLPFCLDLGAQGAATLLTGPVVVPGGVHKTGAPGELVQLPISLHVRRAGRRLRTRQPGQAADKPKKEQQ